MLLLVRCMFLELVCRIFQMYYSFILNSHEMVTFLRSLFNRSGHIQGVEFSACTPPIPFLDVLCSRADKSQEKLCFLQAGGINLVSATMPPLTPRIHHASEAEYYNYEDPWCTRELTIVRGGNT